VIVLAGACCAADGAAKTYTLVEKLFYSAIADFSSMLTTDKRHTFQSLMHAVLRNMSASDATNNSQIRQTHNAIRKFARCQWSPLAVPLPFATDYKPREILGCTRPRQVSQHNPVSSTQHQHRQWINGSFGILFPIANFFYDMPCRLLFSIADYSYTRF